MNRVDTLNELIAETERRHKELSELKAKDEIWFDPDPSSLYCWELVTHRENHKWSALYVAKRAAQRAACDQIVKHLSDFSTKKQHYNDLIDKGLYEEVLSDFSSSSLYFDFHQKEISR